MTSIFEGQPPPKQGPNSNQNKGHLGSRSIYAMSKKAYIDKSVASTHPPHLSAIRSPPGCHKTRVHRAPGPARLPCRSLAFCVFFGFPFRLGGEDAVNKGMLSLKTLESAARKTVLDWSPKNLSQFLFSVFKAISTHRLEECTNVDGFEISRTNTYWQAACPAVILKPTTWYGQTGFN